MRLSSALCCVAALFASLPAVAATKELKVDAFADGGQVRAQGQYVTGERFAIELSGDPADYPLRVTTVRALFIPTFVGGDGQVAPFHLTIYAGTGTETPGAVLWDQGDDFQITASSSSYNEIVLPTPIDVESGSIRISFSPTLDQSDSGVTIGQDEGPIQGTRNFIFAGGAWNRAAALGLTGNFIIRATAETNFGASNPAPVVSSVTPSEVNEGEAATLTIGGANFQAGATVRLGATPLSNVQVAGSTSITAQLAAGVAAGSYALVVTNPDGKSGQRAAAVTIVGGGAGGGGGGGSGGGGGVLVRLDSIVPGVAPAGRAVEFVLFGEAFAAGASVTVGDVAATGVQAINARTLRGVAPSTLAAGPHDVTVTIPGDGSATLAGGWLVVEGGGELGLDVDRVVPALVEKGAGHELVVLGAGFAEGVQITIGGLPLGTPTVLGPTAIAGFTPELAPGLYDVVASWPDGRTASRAEALEVVGALAGDVAEEGSGSAQEDSGCGCAAGQGTQASLLGLVALALLLRRRGRASAR